MDILHEVTGDFSSDELYNVLVRRVARDEETFSAAEGPALRRFGRAT